MQLTMDAHFTNSFCSAKQDQERATVYSKWRLFEYLEYLGIHGQTALISYQDDFLSFSLPIQFGDLHFGLFSNPFQLTMISSKESVIRISGKNPTLVEKNGVHTITYSTVKYGSGKDNRKSQLDLTGKSEFILKEYCYCKQTRMPELTGKETTKEILNKLVGAIIHLKAYCCDDWLSEVKTIPFQVQAIQVDRNRLTLIGDHDVRLCVKGFKSIRRSSNNLILDVFNDGYGYSHTFSIGKSIKELL
ncbi:hypothetical protein [Brevibacillus reuszeri]|uniref:hypothetical protein n=1 Tax=Brevibacillus reuszeri TaxID=54915 RepID=UPI000CCC4A73|nr:hypothetical protein [Brevibacillus reuszeri]